MNNYVDYEYYKTTYKGDLVPSDKFDFYCRKATQYVKINTFNRIDENNVQEEVKMCVCELCEIVYKVENTTRTYGITSEKVGEYSVSYESSQNIKASQEVDMGKTLRLWLADTGLLYKGVC